MQTNKRSIIRTVIAAAVTTGLLLALLAVFSLLTEKGSIDENMMSSAVYASVFGAAFVGSAITNKGKSDGRIIRAMIVALVLFGVPFLIGRGTAGQPAETAHAVVLLAAATAGSIAGAVICNKKRRFNRR